MTRRIISAREQVTLLTPWLKQAEKIDLRWERDSNGDWLLVTRNPDGNPVALDTRRAPSVRMSAKRFLEGDQE